MLWSDENMRTCYPTLTPSAGPLERIKADKEGFITMLMENYKEKSWLRYIVYFKNKKIEFIRVLQKNTDDNKAHAQKTKLLFVNVSHY